jgi:hypothetical protein
MTCDLMLDDGDRVVGYLIEDATGALRVCLPLAADDHTIELDEPLERLRAAVPPRMVPCDWCATPTPGGRFCSAQCRSDAYARRRAERREHIAANEGNPRHA